MTMESHTNVHLCTHVDITLGFDQPMYSAQEATGNFTPGPITIVKESSRVSEQVLTVNLNFVPSGFASATEGI